MKRGLGWMAVATLAGFCCACGPHVKTTRNVPQEQRPVVLDSSKEELLEKYNAQAQAVQTINATVELRPTAGSKYSGVIEEYHEVKAFLLAKRPASVRMIGQVAVIGKTVFDMASDEETFRVWIPSKNQFLVGAVSLERQSEKPIENLRPQHLLDALLWQLIRKEESVLFEEFDDDSGRYYVLTQLRGGYEPQILRKIWFDRANLQVSRLESYGPKGVLISDVRYANWQPSDAPSAPASQANGNGRSATEGVFPRNININRPHDDYSLAMDVIKVVVNEDLPADRFALIQPAGSQLVRVGPDKEPKRR
jgi:hypothetical protein